MQLLRLLFFGILISSWSVQAQKRCAADEINMRNALESEQQFETWLSGIQYQTALAPSMQSTNEVMALPVVFHVIHNGEALGNGVNLSEDKILEQLRILNEDFRRTNSDQTNTPAEFLGVAADTEISFVLAQQDPEGLPTNGIIRVRGDANTYHESQSEQLYANSFWPPEDYINIYIGDLDGYLGWASFPFSNLIGISEVNTNPLNDAIAIDYKYVGINPNTGGRFESHGRTLTHEMGHFLGLRHVWSDVSSCEFDDYCSDTPNQNKNYDAECPNSTQSSCGSNDMYSNYLNYTADACMNVFTQCQKLRMKTVLSHSPRRKTLTKSHALDVPISVANDLGIKSIIGPSQSKCTDELTPIIEIRNYGSNTINAFSISVAVNGNVHQTIDRSVTLPPLATSIISFESILTNSDQGNEITFEVSGVNNGSDQNPTNNVKSITLDPTQPALLPYQLDFESQVNVELRLESMGISNWQVVTAPSASLTNSALSIDFNSLGDDDFGRYDYLLTPVIDLQPVNSAELTFSYTYRNTRNGFDKDGFLVAISEDCGETFHPDNYVFQAYGNSLSTVSERSNQFYLPEGESDWNNVTINLTKYAGNENVRIAFIGHPGGGSQLYLDDIRITPTSLREFDLAIESNEALPLVTCRDNFTTEIEVRNVGFTTMNTYQVNQSINNSSPSQYLSSGEIVVGETDDIRMEFNDLSQGENVIRLWTQSAADQPDENTANDSLSHHLILDTSVVNLPIRVDFEKPSNWFSTNSSGDAIWMEKSIESNGILQAPAFENEGASKSWFISPVLNASTLDSLSLRFKYAYGLRSGFNDRLQVLMSVNCGEDYQYVLFDANGNSLSTAESSGSFIPMDTSDWNDAFIDLTSYLIWEEFRLAFVFTNGQGNNLYIDDIEFLNTANPNRPEFEIQSHVYPNPTRQNVNISFNLPQRENVEVRLMDLSGKTYQLHQYQDILNHTVQLEVPGLSGLFLVQIAGDSFSKSEKIIILK